MIVEAYILCGHGRGFICFNSSVQSIYLEDQKQIEVAMGIVVNYTDSNGFVTEILQDFWTGPIGELRVSATVCNIYARYIILKEPCTKTNQVFETNRLLDIFF